MPEKCAQIRYYTPTLVQQFCWLRLALIRLITPSHRQQVEMVASDVGVEESEEAEEADVVINVVVETHAWIPTDIVDRKLCAYFFLCMLWMLSVILV